MKSTFDMHTSLDESDLYRIGVMVASAVREAMNHSDSGEPFVRVAATEFVELKHRVALANRALAAIDVRQLDDAVGWFLPALNHEDREHAGNIKTMATTLRGIDGLIWTEGKASV